VLAQKLNDCKFTVSRSPVESSETAVIVSDIWVGAAVEKQLDDSLFGWMQANCNALFPYISTSLTNLEICLSMKLKSPVLLTESERETFSSAASVVF
jgi:hypothetical protein